MNCWLVVHWNYFNVTWGSNLSRWILKYAFDKDFFNFKATPSYVPIEKTTEKHDQNYMLLVSFFNYQIGEYW